MKYCIAFALAALLPAMAHAHSPLLRSSPAHQAVMSTSPETLEMTFGHPIRLTRVQFGSDETPLRDLDLSGIDGFITQYELALPSVPSGSYRVEWRGLASDGHTMQGVIVFTVD